MPSLEWTVRDETPTLVELLVSNDRSPMRVRIANRLDGPVWPPRRRGVPASGWDADGVTCTLSSGERRGLGYASPASPADPPAEIVRTEPVLPDADRSGRSTPRFDGQDLPDLSDVPDVDATPAGVVRALGDPRPPRDAVPVDRDETPSTEAPTTGPVPDGVADWLADVEDRVSRAETLADARALDVAGEELVHVGGVTGAGRLVERVQRDEMTLRAVSRKAEALASRAATADVPLESYRRLLR